MGSKDSAAECNIKVLFKKNFINLFSNLFSFWLHSLIIVLIVYYKNFFVLCEVFFMFWILALKCIYLLLDFEI